MELGRVVETQQIPVEHRLEVSNVQESVNATISTHENTIMKKINNMLLNC